MPTSLRRAARPGYRPVLAVVAICFLPLACASSDPSAERRPVPGTREFLPDGRVRVTHPALPVAEDTVTPDLRIGSMLAEGPDVFIEPRGIEVAPDGTLYVLEAQTGEIRVFERNGTYRESLIGQGQNPGVISATNGFALAPDGSFWINDYGSRELLHLSADARELARYPALVPEFGYLWTGSVDHDGVVWDRWSHPVDEPVFDATATGLIESSSRVYYKSFDARTGAYDSVRVAGVRTRSYRVTHSGGQTVLRIPFSPLPLATMDRARNIWSATSDAYVLTRTDTSGDTTLILTVEIPGDVVSPEEIDLWRTQTATTFQDFPPGVRDDIEASIPSTRGILDELLTDDSGRIWIGRVSQDDELPLYDVFDADGTYLGSVRLFPGMYATLPPVIRGGRIYAVLQGNLGELYVVGAPVPPFAARP